MDHSTWAAYRHQQQQQQEQARTLELRRSIAERNELQASQGEALTAGPVRPRRWQGLLIRAHLVHPLSH